MNQSNAATEPSGRSRARDGVLVMTGAFLLALLVRLAYVVSFRDSPFFAGLLVDAHSLDAWARGWAEGTWSMEGRAFFRAPLYPFWVSLVYRIAGHDLLALRVVQAVTGAATAAALAGCGWRIGGKGTGLAAGIAAALYGPLVFFDGEVLIPNLLLALLSWALFALLGRPTRAAALTGLGLLGLAAIARPTALVLIPAALWFLWRRGLARGTLAGALVLSLVPGLWVTLVNAREEGAFVFIASQGGVNFYAGNHAGATGRSVEIPELGGMSGSWTDFVDTSRRIPEAERGRPLSSAEVSSFWFRRGMAWVAAAPADALTLTAKKLYYAVNAFETPSNRSLYADTSFPVNLLLWRVPGFAFPWGILFPLAVAGAVLGLRDPRTRRGAGFLVLWAAAYLLALVPYFVNARFRMGMVPALIVLAALALSRRRSLRAPGVLVPALAALVVVNTGLFDAHVANPAQDRAKLGVTLLGQGEVADAIEALAEAYRLEPTARNAYLLGQAQALAGNREEALRLYRLSMTAVGDNPTLHVNLARSLAELGAFPESARELEAALALDPENGVLWADLGRMYEETDRDAEAVEAYRQAIEHAPDLDRAYLGLGYLYQEQERVEDAIEAWRRGAERVPGSFLLRYNLAVAYGRSGRVAEGLR